MRCRPGLTLALLWALAVPAGASAAESSCFGAAARDPLKPCTVKRADWKVTPTPDAAQLTPNAACTRQELGDTLRQCAYGTPASQAVQTVAVVGDSHAAHWRPALSVVARAKRWRVLELATPHCPLTLAAQNAGKEVARWCPVWNRLVLEWFDAHPEIRTVFFSAHVRAPVVVPKGKTRFQTMFEGYLGAFRMLPDSVERLIVIRDNPIATLRTQDCIRAAVSRRRDPAKACAVPRRKAMPADPAAAAAVQLWMRGGRVADLTDHFCAARACLPVVGGVLVHRDVDHLTRLFARTLGPYLLRETNSALGLVS